MAVPSHRGFWLNLQRTQRYADLLPLGLDSHTGVLTSAFLGSIKDEAQILNGRFIDGISGLYFALGLTTILRGKQWWSRRLGTVTIALLAGSTLVAIYSLPVLLP